MSPTFLGGEYIDLHLILTFSVVVAVGWDQAGPGPGVILECVALWRVGGAGGRGTRLERGVEEQTETTTNTVETIQYSVNAKAKERQETGMSYGMCANCNEE